MQDMIVLKRLLYEGRLLFAQKTVTFTKSYLFKPLKFSEIISIFILTFFKISGTIIPHKTDLTEVQNDKDR